MLPRAKYASKAARVMTMRAAMTAKTAVFFLGAADAGVSDLAASGCPHDRQNFDSDGISLPHLVHFMVS